MIVVTGGTGTIGRHVVDGLHSAGIAFRVMARSPAAARKQLGPVPVVAGDLNDEPSLVSAFAGADRLFLLSAHGPDMEAQQLRAVRVAKRVGIRRIVKISGTNQSIKPDSPADTGREHWRIEQEILGSGLEYVIHRPNFFMQNLLEKPAQMVRAGRPILLPIGADVPISFVDARDLADCSIAALLRDDFVNRVFCPTGEQQTFHNLAQILSDELGKTVRFRKVPLIAAQLAILARDGWFHARHAGQLMKLFAAGGGAEVTGHVQLLTGHAPRSLAAFIREHRAWFS